MYSCVETYIGGKCLILSAYRLPFPVACSYGILIYAGLLLLCFIGLIYIWWLLKD